MAVTDVTVNGEEGRELAPGWDEYTDYTDDESTPYYHNVSTNVTQWERPGDQWRICGDPLESSYSRGETPNHHSPGETLKPAEGYLGEQQLAVFTVDDPEKELQLKKAFAEQWRNYAEAAEQGRNLVRVNYAEQSLAEGYCGTQRAIAERKELEWWSKAQGPPPKLKSQHSSWDDLGRRDHSGCNRLSPTKRKEVPPELMRGSVKLRRRMAVREFSRNRDSPVMLRLLEEIREAQQA